MVVSLTERLTTFTLETPWSGSYEEALRLKVAGVARFRFIDSDPLAACPCCLANYEGHDRVIVLLCSHSLHEACFDAYDKAQFQTHRRATCLLDRRSTEGHVVFLAPQFSLQIQHKLRHEARFLANWLQKNRGGVTSVLRHSLTPLGEFFESLDLSSEQVARLQILMNASLSDEAFIQLVEEIISAIPERDRLNADLVQEGLTLIFGLLKFLSDPSFNPNRFYRFVRWLNEFIDDIEEEYRGRRGELAELASKALRIQKKWGKRLGPRIDFLGRGLFGAIVQRRAQLEEEKAASWERREWYELAKLTVEENLKKAKESLEIHPFIHDTVRIAKDRMFVQEHYAALEGRGWRGKHLYVLTLKREELERLKRLTRDDTTQSAELIHSANFYRIAAFPCCIATTVTLLFMVACLAQLSLLFSDSCHSPT